jgi:hypothetical protein
MVLSYDGFRQVINICCSVLSLSFICIIGNYHDIITPIAVGFDIMVINYFVYQFLRLRGCTGTYSVNRNVTQSAFGDS